MASRPMSKGSGIRFPTPIGRQSAQSQFVIWEQQKRIQGGQPPVEVILAAPTNLQVEIIDE